MYGFSDAPPAVLAPVVIPSVILAPVIIPSVTVAPVIRALVVSSLDVADDVSHFFLHRKIIYKE
ncbi:MAG: hypothetical protein ACKO6N_12905 [Myxococcota bacterium]